MTRSLLLAVLFALPLAGCQSQAPGPETERASETQSDPNDRTQEQAARIKLAQRVGEQEQAGPRAERDAPLAANTEPGTGNDRFERDPEASHRARTFYLLGVKHLSERPPRVDEAIREFQHAIEHDPTFYKAHFKLGYSYYHKGQYELERIEYLKCLAIESRYFPALINLGHAYLAQDKLEMARDAYRRALEVKPNHAICQYNLGLIEFDLGEWHASDRYLRGFLNSKLKEVEGQMGEQARKCLERIGENQAREEAARKGADR